MAMILPCALSAATPKREFVVVIDAGHGGKDSGAAENDAVEKDINLGVALKLGELINKKLKNTKVIYTRDKDEFITLQGRADIANKANADLFISIHTNSVDRSNPSRNTISGSATYVLGKNKDTANRDVEARENGVIELDGNDKAKYSNIDFKKDDSVVVSEMMHNMNQKNSRRFANYVQTEFASLGRKSNGMKEAGFYVLWSTAMPSVLIELDFICNPEQAKFLASQSGQGQLAESIFNAVKRYEKYFRESTGYAAVDEKKENQQQMAKTETKDTPKQTQKPSAKTETKENAVEMAAADNNGATQNMERINRRSTRAGKQTQQKQQTDRRDRAEQKQQPAQKQQPEEVAEEKALSDDEPTVVESDDVAQSDVAKENPKKERKRPRANQQKKDQNKERPLPVARRRASKQNINTVYRIQLFASEKELGKKDEAFKGLDPVSFIHENNMYKYTYGQSKERAEMESLLPEIITIFPEATIIKCISD